MPDNAKHSEADAYDKLAQVAQTPFNPETDGVGLDQLVSANETAGRALRQLQYMASVLHNSQMQCAGLLKENEDLKKKFGELCQDEGCPHFGTLHSHPPKETT